MASASRIQDELVRRRLMLKRLRSGNRLDRPSSAKSAIISPTTRKLEAVTRESRRYRNLRMIWMQVYYKVFVRRIRK